jgi:hypothetical protein
MNKNLVRLSAWVFGALAGGCFVAITQLAVKTDLKEVDRTAMSAFATSLPLLVASALIYRQGIPTKNKIVLRMVMIVATVAPIPMVIGIIDLISSVNLRAAAMFGILGTFMFGLMWLADKNRE